jgi:FKBP-type peptidyl-prolyl cis-trans isomerase
VRNGVKIVDLNVGDGKEASRSTTVRVRLNGYLKQGDRIQSDLDYVINLARRDVIAGLRYGIDGMRTGGRRRLRISPHLAYGQGGISDLIPAMAVLVYEVELLEVYENGSEGVPPLGGQT